jgi:4-oxalocrotonate tautomerase
MPIVSIQIAQREQPLERKKKSELVVAITDVVEHLLNKRRETITVLIEEIPADNWAEGGQLVSETRKNRRIANPDS